MAKDMKKIPKIAMGTWAWGNDGTFGDTLSESGLKPVFAAAMNNGFNLWDTAYVYGMGASEDTLAALLKGIPRDDYLLSDKFTPQIADTSAKNAVFEMFEGSAKRLNTDYIDFYWIHNPVGAPKWIKEIIPLAKEGKIGKIGVSNHNIAEIKEAQNILSKEGLKIEAVQNHYSLLNRSSEKSGILNYCKENGIIFFSYMVLEQGTLTGKYDADHPFPEDSARAEAYNPVIEQIAELNAGLEVIAKDHGVDLAQIPVAWAIAKGTLPIIGVTKVKHVEDAVKAENVKLTEAEISAMEALADKADISTVRGWEKEMK